MIDTAFLLDIINRAGPEFAPAAPPARANPTPASSTGTTAIAAATRPLTAPRCSPARPSKVKNATAVLPVSSSWPLHRGCSPREIYPRPRGQPLHGRQVCAQGWCTRGRPAGSPLVGEDRLRAGKNAIVTFGPEAHNSRRPTDRVLGSVADHLAIEFVETAHSRFRHSPELGWIEYTAERGWVRSPGKQAPAAAVELGVGAGSDRLPPRRVYRARGRHTVASAPTVRGVLYSRAIRPAHGRRAACPMGCRPASFEHAIRHRRPEGMARCDPAPPPTCI